jgi:tRNA-specific 2-thiouridylase
MMDQYQLSRTLFPVGEMTKTVVREHAARLGMRTANKPDSQDVCFITSAKDNEGRSGRVSFIGRRIPLNPAVVVDELGNELGSVESVELVTLGQRRGVAGGGGTKRFVVDIDVPGRKVVVGPESMLMVDHEVVDNVVWSNEPYVGAARVQCSAHGEPRSAVLSVDDAGRVIATWTEPQRRISPGQSAVFYDADDRFVLGGGLVTRSVQMSNQ